MASLSVRNVVMDISMEDRTLSPISSIANRVPVFHIFGSLPTGEKACLHVHGVLPYIILRASGTYTPEMVMMIERRINNLIMKELEKEGIEDKTRRGFVVSIEKTVGRSIYGFHPADENFIKIHFASTFYSTRAATALSSTSSSLLQPFDAHVPFHLQFAMDHSIFGMDFVSVRNARFRIGRNRRDHEVLFDEYTIGEVMRDTNLTSPLAPQSTSHIEIDVLAKDIINHELHASNEYSLNPGIEYIWKDEIERRKGEVVIDTFTKCCQEKRPSMQLDEEKDFLNLLRENIDELKERLEGMNWKESFYESLNETDLTKAWTQLQAAMENRPASQISRNTATEAGIGMDKTVWDIASAKDEEWMWKGDEADREEEDNDEDENRLMQHTFAQIESAQIERQTHRRYVEEEIREEKRKNEKETEETIIVPTRIEEEVPERALSHESQPVTSDGTRRQSTTTRKTNWRQRKKRLPKVSGLDAKKKVIEQVQVIVNEKQKETGEEMKAKEMKQSAKSYHNRFDAATTQSGTTLMLAPKQTQEEEEMRGELRYLSVVSLELAMSTMSEIPNPMVDSIVAASVCFYSDICTQSSPDTHLVLMVDSDSCAHNDSSVFTVPTERDLLETLIRFVKRSDPDLLIGYDCDRLSWGYLFQRCDALKRRAFIELSRIAPRGGPTLSPTGRLTLSVWRIVRSDLKLRAYDRASALFEVTKRRIPTFNQPTLSRLYTEGRKRSRRLLANMLLRYSQSNIDILMGINFFAVTAEMARVYGIQFEEVMTRGSQLRVESMLLRFCRRLGLFCPSITPDQRSEMRAPEQLQLVMEPQSGLYLDPVIVLDFQSLYPSMAIAYNYCYSTCMGGVSQSMQLASGVHDISLGALSYRVPIRSLIRVTSEEKVHISPLGSVFLKWNEKEGIVPKMLREILAARIMVKQAAKGCTSKRLSRILDARQLALKLVANVTYGYTAANWSGRMPCVEVADAILGKGRETLERAINMVNGGGEKYMGARVIYGDTDSMFVLVEGATREDAFKVGRAIAQDVTADNPAPVVLKLEKVYDGCLLQTKKKYAGISFESETEKEGKFDAKGIETVRRDTCPVVARMLERALRFLLAGDLRGLSTYLDDKLSRINELPYTDFVFCKEYRGDYSPIARVPQAKIALQSTALCPLAAPLVGDRVPFVVVNGEPSATVYSCVRSIEDFLRNPSEDIHYSYYVHAHVQAAIHRCMALIPVRIQWYPATRPTGTLPVCTTNECGHSGNSLCAVCFLRASSLQLQTLQTGRVSRTQVNCRKQCKTCLGCATSSFSDCRSLSCPIHKLLVSIKKNPDSTLVTHLFHSRVGLEF